MKCQADIEALANDKLIDAECLFKSDRYDSAYYLAGYSVELLLKAKVCKTLGIENFFDFNNASKAKFMAKNVDNVFKSYRVHDYSQLLLLSGVYTEFYDELNTNANLKSDWSIVSQWNENSRYLTGISKEEVENFLTSIKEIMSWIQKRL